MKASCIVFGGAGFIGTNLVKQLLSNGQFDNIVIADLQDSVLKDAKGIQVIKVDVREPIPEAITDGHVIEWIFNLAAICIEPGFESHEYHETNVLGATNVCEFAMKVNCKNIFFTSSMALYGPTLGPTTENMLPMPDTPYGISKLAAEYIHRIWAEKRIDRRLISVRPAVIFGPGDSGNILRMIKAVKSGYFILPVKPTLKKSYGYIYGLMDSIDFCMNKEDKVIIYNYAEKETEDLGSMVKIIGESFGLKPFLIRFPYPILKFIALMLNKLKVNINGIHPERVKKVARPTHIVPQFLIDNGFEFKYDLLSSLENWKQAGLK